jgi:hypothetical protein
MAADRRDSTLPPGVVEDLLAEPRRRRALAALAGADGPLPLDQVARRVAAEEAGCPPAAVDRATCRRVREAIRAEDLPKLLATAVVRYHSGRDAVELAPAADQFRDRLER